MNQKNLIYIANIRLPTEKAHGIQIMKMCEAFASEGASVELWVPDRKTEIKADPFSYYRSRSTFIIRRLPTIDLIKWGKWGFRFQSFTFALSALYRLSKIKAKKYLIYSRDEMPLYFASFINKNLMWEAHMGHINFFIKRLIKKKIKIVSITEGLKNFYIENGATQNLVHVASDGVDIDQFRISEPGEEIRKRLGLPADKKIVMYVGLFDEWKGYMTALEASRLIGDENVVFVMIGEGKNSQHLRARFPHVIFLGYKPYSELPMNQKAADILLVPNSARFKISSHFTSPIKLFAHMASGVPIVASNLPSLKEVLDNEIAYFFTPDDPQELAQTIKTVLAQPMEAERKAQAALGRVANFSWNKRAEGILKFST